jgi:hypothetical protein
MRSKVARLAVALVSCLAVVSCSSSSGPEGGQNKPKVVGVNLEDGATDVGLIQRIDVTFSDEMDPTTISNLNIMVAGRAPTGHVEYDGETYTASFIPDTLYAAEVWHDFIVTSGVKSADGRAVEPDTTSFRTGTLDNDHLDDYFEPNETPAAATPVEFDRRYRTLSLTSYTDDDLYEFTVTETAKVRVHWWIKAIEDMDWAVTFCNDQGQSYYATGMVPSARDTAHWWNIKFLPGTYYLHTEANGGHYGHLLYDLELTTDEPCRDDPYEDNDFVEDAASIDPGTYEGLRMCGLDMDYYAVDLEYGDVLSASMTATGGSNMYDVKRIAILLPTGYEAVWVQTYSSPTLGTSYVASVAGTYYVSTRSWTEYLEYTLEVTVN